MIRRLFTFASLLSVVLCVALAVVWVRSYVREAGEWVRGRYSAGEYVAGCRRGELFVVIEPYPRAFPVARVSGPQPIGNSAMILAYQERRFLAGVSLRDIYSPTPLSAGPTTKQLVSRTVAVQCWAAGVMLAVLPACWTFLRLRRRRRLGCCPVCDYNLTGNTSGVCPECGTHTFAEAKA
jgi:hypothetical protein